MPNRGPLILSIDEAEYLLDQLPPPDSDTFNDPNDIANKVRLRLQEFLKELRSGAEGAAAKGPAS